MQQALKEGMAAFRAAEAQGAVVQPAPRKPSIASHRAFVPMLTIWGAALGGLSVAVLPRAMIMQAAMFTGLAGLGPLTRFALAAVAAIALGALAFTISGLVRRRAARSGVKDPVAAMLAEKVRPIDPVSELGSESLDAPIEESASDAQLQLCDPEARAQNCFAGADDDSDPREMGLEEFGALPGRNAVWVGDDDGVAEQEPCPDEYGHEDAAPEEPPQTAQSAIEKLRSVPPGDLSLVQMVERFAAALHERQATERRNPGSLRSPGRDAALADALRALTVLSEAGFGSGSALHGENAADLQDKTLELRKALGKLQSLRETG